MVTVNPRQRLKRAARIMDHVTAYRLWQAPFQHYKFAPIRRHNQLPRARRVLDVGCGPGTNSACFRQQEYLGIDVNPGYIEFARRRYGRRFEVADATRYRPPSGELFDFVLLNSLLHHLPTDDVRRMLDALRTTICSGGHIHIVDLVLPSEPGIPRYLAVNDRGDFSRPLEQWQHLFEEAYEAVVFEPFQIRMLGVTLWQLIYFKGRPR